MREPATRPRLGLWAAVAFLTAATAGTASASAIYTYAGNPFVSIFDGAVPGTYTTSDSVNGSITLSSSLAPDLAPTDIGALVEAFSFSDGRTTFTEADSFAGLTFFVSTDSSGDIDEWIVEFFVSSGGDFDQILSCSVPDSDPAWTTSGLVPAVACPISGHTTDSGVLFDNSIPGSDSASVSSPGTWAQVPEPAEAFLLGLLAFDLARRRRS